MSESVRSVALHGERDAWHREVGFAEHIHNHSIGIEINLPVMGGVGVWAHGQTWTPLAEFQDFHVGINPLGLVGDLFDAFFQQLNGFCDVSAVIELGDKLDASVRRG